MKKKYPGIVEQKKTRPLITKPKVESPTSIKFNGKTSSNSWFEINNIDVHDSTKKDSLSNTLNAFEKRSRKRDNFLNYSTSQLETKNDSSYITQFIHRFVLDKSKQREAIIIQQAFRRHQYRQMLNSKGKILIKERTNLLRKSLLSWHLIAPIRNETLKEEYQKFVENVLSDQFNSNPFFLFYISDSFKKSNVMSYNDQFKLIHLLWMSSMRKILDSWNQIAKKRIQQRSKLRSIKFPVHKTVSFCGVNQIFIIWYRYTKFKRNPVKIQYSEISIKWNCLEKKLLIKKSKNDKASFANKVRLFKKVKRALFNLLILSRSSTFLIKKSDEIRNRYLMNKAHRAWNKYAQIRSQENSTLHEIMKRWYMYTNNRINFNELTKVSIIFDQKRCLTKTLLKWHQISRINKTKELEMITKIQQHPSNGFKIIFLLKGYYELFFLVNCFQKWAKYSLSRIRMKKYQNWINDIDPDIELKNSIFIELRKNKLRDVETQTKTIFPHNIGFSLEMNLKQIELNKRNFDNNNNSLKRWKFQTETNEKEIKFNGEFLKRCLIMAAHLIKPFNINVSNQNDLNDFYERNRTIEEIQNQLNQNIKRLRYNIRGQIPYYISIVSEFESHSMAVMFANVSKDFSFDQNKKIAFFREFKLDETPIEIYSETLESLQFIRSQYAEKSVSDAMKNILENIKIEKRKIVKFTESKLNEEKTENLNEAKEEAKSSKTLDSKRVNTSRDFSASVMIKLFSSISSIQIVNAMAKIFSVFFHCKFDDIKLLSAHDFPEAVGKTRWHKVRGNINFFINEFININTDKKNTSCDLSEISKFAKGVVAAIISFHKELLKNHISQYLDQSPFSEKIKITSTDYEGFCSSIWLALKSKDNSLKIPSSKDYPISASGPSSVQIPSMDFITSKKKNAELLSFDAYIVCFLIPFVVPSDLVSDFIKGEISVNE